MSAGGSTELEKAEIRREMKARRRSLAAEEKARWDAAICEKLKSSFCTGEAARSPHCGGLLAVYLAMPDEINIDPFIEYLLRSGFEAVAPRWNGETYDLVRLKGLGEKNLRRGPMGIREPVGDDTVDPKEVHAWIVPGLAFTRDGKRLGYGGGWYDRFLAAAPEDAVKIGVAYMFQIVGKLPAGPHDAPMTGLVDAGKTIAGTGRICR